MNRWECEAREGEIIPQAKIDELSATSKAKHATKEDAEKKFKHAEAEFLAANSAFMAAHHRTSIAREAVEDLDARFERAFAPAEAPAEQPVPTVRDFSMSEPWPASFGAAQK